MIPDNIQADVFIVNPDSAISGIRWMNVSPSNAPAEKLTRNRRIFFNMFVPKVIVNMPISDIRLTINTLAKV